jgi:hypothetical protein
MQEETWLTPPHILRALGPFDLDPCAALQQPWRTAHRQFTILENGLNQEWSGRVWCNPPYGQKTGQWLAKLADHGDGIALIFARTETAMFFDHVWNRASALLFIEGRLHFHHIDGTKAKANAGAPSVLIAYGESCAQRLRNSLREISGHYIQLKGCE